MAAGPEMLEALRLVAMLDLEKLDGIKGGWKAHPRGNVR
jgi:hypothetical protein